MKFDVPKIESILNSVSEDTSTSDWDYDKGLCWQNWQSNFFGKNSRNLKIDRDISFIERVKKMKSFEKSDQSEKSFNKFYPDYKYDVYKSPCDFNYRIVSIDKIQKIAFELQ